MPTKKRLVLFDFDGTITTKDTLKEFLIFYKGRLHFFLGMLILSPIVAAYLLKLMPNWKAKQWCLRFFIGGDDLTTFEKGCLDFSARVLPTLVRPGALQTIEANKKTGTIICIVTASAENWVRPWCDKNGLLCLATQLEVNENKITGNLCGANCYGPEKVKRIKQEFQLSEFDEIIAYGDSSGDREMFGIAHQFYYKPFIAD